MPSWLGILSALYVLRLQLAPCPEDHDVLTHVSPVQHMHLSCDSVQLRTHQLYTASQATPSELRVHGGQGAIWRYWQDLIALGIPVS